MIHIKQMYPDGVERTLNYDSFMLKKCIKAKDGDFVSCDYARNNEEYECLTKKFDAEKTMCYDLIEYNSRYFEGKMTNPYISIMQHEENVMVQLMLIGFLHV